MSDYFKIGLDCTFLSFWDYYIILYVYISPEISPSINVNGNVDRGFLPTNGTYNGGIMKLGYEWENHGILMRYITILMVAALDLTVKNRDIVEIW